MKLINFRLRIFLIATVIVCLIAVVTFIAAAARDEGTGGSGLIGKTLENVFYIVRFPTHTLFFEHMNGSIFFLGLFINCLFYGLITERVISFFKGQHANL